ncbi:MAG: hypothetical protein H7Y05_14480 [Steroidobacteraceae bacterium]|nr:hypothetical protein [Deltaproteobacteria bacterium]
MAVAALLGTLATTVAAQVPDTNSYWKNFTVIEKQAKRLLDGALQSCRGRSGAEAEAALREWKASLQPEKYPGSEFNPCSGSGTLVTGKTTLVASNGIAIRLSENGPLQTEWDLRARTVKLWYGGDHISFSINPISVSLLRASLVFSSTQGQYLPATATISEGQIISGLEAFWRSAHEHYPTHSMYDVALQVITGKDQGREMLLDFIRCGKSICD